jgi:putative ABC transport system substrate-binding protein
LVHDSLTSTNRTLQGSRKVIQAEHADADFRTYLIGNDNAQNKTIIDSVSAQKPSLILTVGTAATEFAQRNFTSTPIVFSAVTYPVLSGFVSSMNSPGGNLTGASLNIPFDIQFKYFLEVVPNLKRVGVLYTKGTAALITQATVVAREIGIELVSIRVDDLKELPKALDDLAASTQAIWTVADPDLFDPRSTKFLLLNALRKGLPVMGFSRHVVESGALFALDFDYKAIGMQAGEIANRVIAGTAPATIPVTVADIIWFHYNENTAERINIKIPDELVAVAKEVYR